MSLVHIKTVDGDDISFYYTGEPANCPPVPAVGQCIEGTFGKGEVSKVEHIVDGSLYTIKLHFTKTEEFYEPTGF